MWVTQDLENQVRDFVLYSNLKENLLWDFEMVVQ